MATELTVIETYLLTATVPTIAKITLVNVLDAILLSSKPMHP